MSIRVIQVGLGPIGNAVLGQLVARSGFKVVGAVDIDPSKIGHDVGLLAGIGRRLGVTVDPDIGSTCRRVKADAVVLCTSSSLKQVTMQIETILRVKLPIVSTSEELSYPVT
ncbi:MAG: dihydrodipicolinate reductase, partial [Acidobacteriota bacterium]|nr:dihydrodipicolinate reductase [Acidobacteriota bacterium]